jgi:hypothetical protein
VTAYLLPAFHATMRRVALLGLLVAGAVYVVLSATTVPNLQGDPTIPRARATLLVGCAAASLLCLYLRPLLWHEERLAARNLVVARLGLVASAVGGWLGLCWVAVTYTHGHGFATQRLAVTGALVGIALSFGHLGSFWGVLAPWCYVISGLAFGYQSGVAGAGVQVRPWAWLVATNGDAEPIIEGALLLVGLGIAGLRPLRE